MDDPPLTLSEALGDQAEKVEERVRSGEYASPAEVVRAGLEALEREERAFSAMLKVKVEEALNDPRPWLTLDELSARMETFMREEAAADR